MAKALSSRWFLLRLAMALLVLLQGSPLARAQVLSENQVKAAYLFNFAKFVEWPPQGFASPDAPFRFCVLGDQSMETALGDITRGKSIGSRSITVSRVPDAEASRGCHLLFIDASQSRHLHQVLDAVHETSTLTVGETKAFLDEGGIINFIMEDERVHFQVNDKAARQAGLHISSRLLVLAKLVIQ